MHSIEFENCRDSCEGVVTWFLREYIPKGLFFLVVVEKDLSKEGVLGWCIRETENEFLIQIHNELDENYTSILLHELEHMRRYYLGLDQNEDDVLSDELKLLDKYHEKD